ncbi:MAG: hypothetical protein ABIP51_01145 [Bacteroidia bacterium]
MSKRTKDVNYPSKKNVEEFEILNPLLNGLFSEVKALSQKKQDGVLNVYKVKMMNKILLRVKQLLVNDPAVEFLDLLDEGTMPTNSDALFMIVQFKSVMQQFKNKYYVQINSSDFIDYETKYDWQTND